MFSTIDKEFQRMFARFDRDLDRDFGMPFHSQLANWNMPRLTHDFFAQPDSASGCNSDFEPETMLPDPEHTTYRMKTVINNNGKVTVKTVRKDPGSEWETQVRQFDVNNAIEEGSEKAVAIEEEANCNGQEGELHH